MVKKLLMLIPAYRKRIEKQEVDRNLKLAQEEEARTARAYRGKICHFKLMERLRDAPTIRAARNKRLRKRLKAQKLAGIVEKRRNSGIVIDEINHPELYNSNQGGELCRS